MHMFSLKFLFFLLSDFNETRTFCRDFSKVTQISNLIKFGTVTADLSHADRWTDVRTESLFTICERTEKNEVASFNLQTLDVKTGKYTSVFASQSVPTDLWQQLTATLLPFGVYKTYILQTWLKILNKAVLQLYDTPKTVQIQLNTDRPT